MFFSFAYINIVFFLHATIILILVIGILFLLSAKGRAVYRHFKNFFHEKPAYISIPVLFFILLTTLFFFDSKPTSKSDFNLKKHNQIQDSLILDFTEHTVLNLAKKIHMQVDSQVDLSQMTTELIYVLPTSLNAFKNITRKEKMPVLSQIDSSSFSLKAEGFGVFKNRGYRIKNTLQMKLGNDYIVSFIDPNEIKVQYKGYPWNMELKLSVLLLKIALEQEIDPALLMSLTKNYEGFVSIQKTPELKRFRELAKRLKSRLEEYSSMEDALASIYFKSTSPKDLPLKWWKQPLARNWVHQVFIDAQIYRDYGFSLEEP